MGAFTATAFKQRLELAGDAFLLTAAALAVVIGGSTLIIAPQGAPRPGTEWAEVMSAFLTLAVVVAFPVAAWLLHQRRISGLAVLGGVLGAASAAAVFFAVIVLSAVLGWILSPLTDAEFAGPLAALVLVSAGCLALMVWLVIDGITDLASGRRAHVAVDVTRFVATAWLIVYSTAVVVWVLGHPGDDSADAIVFAMLAGLVGALAVLGADLMSSLGAGGTAPGRHKLPRGQQIPAGG